MDFEEITIIYDEATAITSEGPSSQSATLRLYDIFIPLLGFFIISLNLLVVISSGLLLQKRKFHYVSVSPFPLGLIKADLVDGDPIVPSTTKNFPAQLFTLAISMCSRSTAEKHVSLPGQRRIIRFADWCCRAVRLVLSQIHPIGCFVRCSTG